jgi:hypothetical protein
MVREEVLKLVVKNSKKQALGKDSSLAKLTSELSTNVSDIGDTPNTTFDNRSSMDSGGNTFMKPQVVKNEQSFQEKIHEFDQTIIPQIVKRYASSLSNYEDLQ